MNYDEMLKTTQKKAQVINTNIKQKKLNLAQPADKNKLKPVKGIEQDFISKQTAAQNAFKKQYMSRKSGFDIIDDLEIQKSSFEPIQESVELRSYDKTFKNRVKKDAKQWVSKWNDACKINDLEKKGYGFKIASKNVNYKTYSMMVGLNNWANSQKFKEKCAAKLIGNDFYQKNKKIIDGLAPSLQMDIKAVKESEESSNNPLVLDSDFKKFTAQSVEAVRKYYEQFNTKDEKLQAQLLKNAFEDSLISMDYINDKALSADAMPQRIMENKLLRDRLEAIHLYSVSSSEDSINRYSEHVNAARKLFMALDADMRACFVKNGMDFTENGKFLLEMNRQGVQLNNKQKMLSTAFHNLSKKHKDYGHNAEAFLIGLKKRETVKKYNENINYFDEFNKELEYKLEDNSKSGDDELGIGQAVVNMQMANENKYKANKAMLDPMIEDAKKVAFYVDNLKNQIAYMEKISSGENVPDDSAGLSMRVQRNENLKRSLNANIEQKKRQVIVLLERANGFMNAMSNIYNDTELSPEGQDIIEKYRLNPDNYVDKSQTAQLLRKIGEIPNINHQFRNMPQLKVRLADKLFKAKVDSLAETKEKVKDEEKEKILAWLNSPEGSLCIADLELQGNDLLNLDEEELYNAMRKYAPLLGELGVQKSKNRLMRMQKELEEKNSAKKEGEIIEAIKAKITNISKEFQEFFIKNFGSMDDLVQQTSTAKSFRNKIESLIKLREKYDVVQKVLYSVVTAKDPITQNTTAKTLFDSLKDKMSAEGKDAFDKLQLMYQKELKFVDNTLFEFKLGELVKKLDIGVGVDQIIKDKIFGDQPDIYGLINEFRGSSENASDEDCIAQIKTFYGMHKEYTQNNIKDLIGHLGKKEVGADQEYTYEANINFFIKKLREYSAGKYDEIEEENLLNEVKTELQKEREEKNAKKLLEEQKKLEEKAFGSMNKFNENNIELDEISEEELEKRIDDLLDIGNINAPNSLQFSFADIAKGNELLYGVDKSILYMDEKYLDQKEIEAREEYMLLLNNIVTAKNMLKIGFINEEDDDYISQVRLETRKIALLKTTEERIAAKEQLKSKLLKGEMNDLSDGAKLRLLLMCDGNIAGKTVGNIALNTTVTNEEGKIIGHKNTNIKLKKNFSKDEIKEILREYEKLSFSPMATWRDEANGIAEQQRREEQKQIEDMVSVPENLQEEVDRLLGMGKVVPSGNIKRYSTSIWKNPKLIMETLLNDQEFDKRILYVNEKYLTNEEKETKNKYLTNIYSVYKAFKEVYGNVAIEKRKEAKEYGFTMPEPLYEDINSDYDSAIIMDVAKRLAVKGLSKDDEEKLKESVERLMEEDSGYDTATRFRLKLLYYNRFGVDYKELHGRGVPDLEAGIFNMLRDNSKLLGNDKFVDDTDYKYRKSFEKMRLNKLFIANAPKEGLAGEFYKAKLDTDDIARIVFTQDIMSAEDLFAANEKYLSDVGKLSKKFMRDFFKGVHDYIGNSQIQNTSISDAEAKELSYILGSTSFDILELKDQLRALQNDLMKTGRYSSYSEGFKVRLAGIISSYSALVDEHKEFADGKALGKSRRKASQREEKEAKRLENYNGDLKKKYAYLHQYNDESTAGLAKMFDDEEIPSYVKVTQIDDTYLGNMFAKEDEAWEKQIEKINAEIRQAKAEEAQKKIEKVKNKILIKLINEYDATAKRNADRSKVFIRLANMNYSRNPYDQKAKRIIDAVEARTGMHNEFKKIFLAKDIKEMYRAFDSKILFIETALLKKYEKTTISTFFRLKEKLMQYKEELDNRNRPSDLTISEDETVLLGKIMDSLYLYGTGSKESNDLKKNISTELKKQNGGKFKMCSEAFRTRLNILMHLNYEHPSEKNTFFRTNKQANIERYYANLEKLGFDENEKSIFDTEKLQYLQRAHELEQERMANELNAADNELDELENSQEQNENAQVQGENVQAQNENAQVQNEVELEKIEDPLDKLIKQQDQGALKNKGKAKDEYEIDLYKTIIDEDIRDEIKNLEKKFKDMDDFSIKRKYSLDDEPEVKEQVKKVIVNAIKEINLEEEESKENNDSSENNLDQSINESVNKSLENSIEDSIEDSQKDIEKEVEKNIKQSGIELSEEEKNQIVEDVSEKLEKSKADIAQNVIEKINDGKYDKALNDVASALANDVLKQANDEIITTEKVVTNFIDDVFKAELDKIMKQTVIEKVEEVKEEEKKEEEKKVEEQKEEPLEDSFDKGIGEIDQFDEQEIDDDELNTSKLELDEKLEKSFIGDDISIAEELEKEDQAHIKRQKEAEMELRRKKVEELFEEDKKLYGQMEEEAKRREEEKEKERLKEEKKALEKYEKEKNEYLTKLEKARAIRTEELEKILDKKVDDDLMAMEKAVEDMNEEQEKKAIDELTDKKFGYGNKNDDYAEIPSWKFKLYCTNKYSEYRFLQNDISKKDPDIDRKVLFRHVLMTRSQKDLEQSMYWKYVSGLPKTDFRYRFYIRLKGEQDFDGKELHMEKLPPKATELKELDKKFMNDLFGKIDDYVSSEQLKSQMYKLGKKEDYKGFYKDGELKTGTRCVKMFNDFVRIWESIETTERNEQQDDENIFKALHAHSNIIITKTKDYYKDKHTIDKMIENGDTFENQMHDNSCYATCSAYLLNKFLAQNKDLSDKKMLKENGSGSTWGKDYKKCFVNQEDFIPKNVSINNFVMKALGIKKGSPEYNPGYKEALDEVDKIGNEGKEGNIYNLADSFVKMSKNVSVHTIEFGEFASVYRKAFKNTKLKGNSLLDIKDENKPVGVDKDKLWHYTPYMTDLRENMYKTVFAKVQELLTERPDTPIALLSSDYGAGGHYVIIRGTTKDGRLLVMNPKHEKTKFDDIKENIPDQIWDMDKLFGNSDASPSFTLTWLERFDSDKAKEIEKKCAMKGAYYNEKGELIDSEKAEKASLELHNDRLLHKNGVSLEVLDKYKGDSGNLFSHNIYVPKTYDPTVK